MEIIEVMETMETNQPAQGVELDLSNGRCAWCEVPLHNTVCELYRV